MAPPSGHRMQGVAARPGADAEDRGTASELEEALALTGDIYDAALDPSHWPEVLRKLAGFAGTTISALTSADIASRKGGFYYSWGDDPHYKQLYFEKYIKLNPFLVPFMLLDAGEVRAVGEVIPVDQLHATRFYREWASPGGYGDTTIGVIQKSASALTLLTASRDDRGSPMDGRPRRRLELLVPHVRRAVAIGQAIEMHKIDADVLADAVDALTAGVFLVDDAGCVIRANAAARAMLAAGDMLCLHDGALAVQGARGTPHALTEAIGGAIRGDLIVSRHGVAIALATGSGDRYAAHVLPLTSGRRRASGAGAAVFVHKAALGGLLPLEAMAQQFGLSAAELRVLAVVMEIGGSVPEIAEVLGLSEPTVKTHLRRLFEKTGTRRQADLVRLVAGYASPLAR